MTKRDRDTASIFLAALAVESEELRKQHLDRVCDDDEALSYRIEELLAVYPKVERFLESPATDAGVNVDEPAPLERPGAAIGPYKLLEVIGEGGMGTVYMAEQALPMRRKVALKI